MTVQLRTRPDDEDKTISIEVGYANSKEHIDTSQSVSLTSAPSKVFAYFSNRADTSYDLPSILIFVKIRTSQNETDISRLVVEIFRMKSRSWKLYKKT